MERTHPRPGRPTQDAGRADDASDEGVRSVDLRAPVEPPTTMSAGGASAGRSSDSAPAGVVGVLVVVLPA
jgi:hypothetical protein